MRARRHSSAPPPSHFAGVVFCPPRECAGKNCLRQIIVFDAPSGAARPRHSRSSGCATRAEFRLSKRPDALRHAGNRWRLKQTRQWDLHIEGGPQPRKQLCAEHGMPAQLKKIVVDADVIDAEKFLPYLCYHALHFIGWSCTAIAGLFGRASHALRRNCTWRRDYAGPRAIKNLRRRIPLFVLPRLRVDPVTLAVESIRWQWNPAPPFVTPKSWPIHFVAHKPQAAEGGQQPLHLRSVFVKVRHRGNDGMFRQLIRMLVRDAAKSVARSHFKERSLRSLQDTSHAVGETHRARRVRSPVIGIRR